MIVRVMLPTMMCLVVSLCTVRSEDRPRLKVLGSKALPAITSVEVFATDSRRLPAGKSRPIVSIKELGKEIVLPDSGPLAVVVHPKNGERVLAVSRLSIRAGTTFSLKLADVLGSVDVFRADDFPRVKSIVLTKPDDPGPDEKGHERLQSVTDYRIELLVPEGFYSVWLVPENGARAKRVADRIRVHAGRSITVGKE